MTTAEAHLCRVGIVLDVDGVLQRHGVPIPGSPEALATLRQLRIPHVFMTNAGCRSEAAKAAQISDVIGYPVLPSQVVLSHTPYRHFAETYRDRRVLLIGSEDGREAATNYGFANIVTSRELSLEWPELVPFKCFMDPADDERASRSKARHNALAASGAEGKATLKNELRDALRFGAVLAFELSGADLMADVQLAIDALVDMDLPPDQREQRCDIYLHCDDFFWAAADVVAPRLGEMVLRHTISSMFRLATNGAHRLRVVQMGKPRRVSFIEARECLRREATRLGFDDVDTVVMIGDNPLTDIAGANRAGWVSVLVHTGVAALVPLVADDYFRAEHDPEAEELFQNIGTYCVPSMEADSFIEFVRQKLPSLHRDV